MLSYIKALIHYGEVSEDILGGTWRRVEKISGKTIGTTDVASA